MMVAENTETRIWACPICGEQVAVGLTWRQRDVGLIKVLHVDDVNARVHMEWHRLCTCRWEPLPPDAPQVVLRHPDPACEMHP